MPKLARSTTFLLECRRCLPGLRVYGVYMIRLKAISPDNEYELQQLFYLFEELPYHSKLVEDLSYLSNNILKKFTSVLILNNNDIVGHFAIEWDLNHSRGGKIILPILKPDAYSLMPEIGSSILQLIKGESLTKNWNYICCSTDLNQLAIQELLLNYLGASVFALLPVRHSENITDLKFDALFFGCCKQFEITKLFIPEKHLGIWRYLTNQNAIQVETATNTNTESFMPSSDKSENLNFSGMNYPTLYPTQLNSNGLKGSDLGLFLNGMDTVFIDLTDSSTPEFCEQLEEIGYHFCGFAPLVKEGTFILYSNSATQIMPLDTCHPPRAQLLAHYLHSQNLVESLKIVGHSPIRKSQLVIGDLEAKHPI